MWGVSMATKSWSAVRPEKGRRSSRHRRDTEAEQPTEPSNGRAAGFHAQLSGLHQVPPVLSPGSGSFRAELTDDGKSLRYELTYANLTTPATAAHIHFGHSFDNGGIMAFLCGGGDAAACPGQGGSVSGTIEPDDVLAIPSQGLPAGDFASVIRLMRAGLVYVNVHTPTFPEGEIRGQIEVS